MEAMSSGVAVVASRLSGIPEKGGYPSKCGGAGGARAMVEAMT